MKKKGLHLFLAAVMAISCLQMTVPASELQMEQASVLEDEAEGIPESVFLDEVEENDFPINEEWSDGTEPEETQDEELSEENADEESQTDSETFELETSDFTIFSSENAEMLQAETEEDQQLLEEIQSGEILAVTPVSNAVLGSSPMLMSAAEDTGAVQTGETSALTLRIGSYLTMEEVWSNDYTHKDHLGTVYRTIHYTDDEGVDRYSPVFCMNPSKDGPVNHMEVKEEAIKILNNSSIKKILYYGYGGPGDISENYDPTCSHVDWSKKTNRYVLTHYALSKVYSGDISGATAAECEHVGLNRWIQKLTSYALPNLSDLKFYGKNQNGDTVSAKDMIGNLTYFKNVPDSLAWTGMKDGVQISFVYSLTASESKNGFKITRNAEDEWVLGYWTDADDYSTRGRDNPRVLGKGKSVTLYKGARFRIAFPNSVTKNQKFSFTSRLKPIQFIVISSSKLIGGDAQDLSTYYYEGARESLSFTVQPAPSGTVLLKKTADHDETMKIEGACYQLVAAENILSNGVNVLKKDEVVGEGYTDGNGELQFNYIPVGNYYLVETGVKEGTEAEKYLVDLNQHPLSVVQNSSTTVTVREIPDLRGQVSIRKVIAGTELNLEGAIFTLYTWNKTEQAYTNGVNLTYSAESKRYESDVLQYTENNQGKFLLKETRNPDGFTGSFQKEIVLKQFGQKELFEYTVENEPAPARVEITKQDSVTKQVLKDAEFTLFPWNEVKGVYENTGEILVFDEVNGRYNSSILKITDLNKGRYKIVETRNPDGYTGSFEKEINLNDSNPKLQFVVENHPITTVKRSFQIKKTDAETGELLTGAQFEVYQYNMSTGQYENSLGSNAVMTYDERIQRYVSTELVVDSKNNGKFKVVETKAPAGYLCSWEKELVLTEEHEEPLLLEAVNHRDRPAVGEVTVIKKIKEKDLIRAHGNPVFTFVLEGRDIKGSNRKYENYICFSPGGYSLDENGNAILQITFKNVPVGQYQVYEKPVLYYYLEDAYANTSNVVISKGASPAYGVLPKDIAYGSITLTASEKSASVTFVNKKARYDSYIHNDVMKNHIPVKF